MNIKTVLTDHSLIGFADVRKGFFRKETRNNLCQFGKKHFQKMIFEPFESAIVCNKLLEGTLCDKLTLGRTSY